MSPQAAAINAGVVRAALTMRATVYARTGGTGPYNQAVRTGLACRLDEVQGGRQPGATGSERRDLANIGTFRWDAGYDMPTAGVQVEVTHELVGGTLVASHLAGQRWNPVAATAWPDDVPGIGIVGRSIDVVRAG